MAVNIAEKPETDQSPVYSPTAKQETLLSWLYSIGVSGVKSLPGVIKSTLIQIGIAVLFQFVFWWEAIMQYIPAFIRDPVIFLTATYNDIIPKTIYWVIIFTFGKKLLANIKKHGFTKAMLPIKALPRELKKAYSFLEDKALSLLLMGGGVGLIIANNFASYSRYGGARNKMDKYFIALVISFTISYLLGEGRRHWVFTFSRLTASDLSRVFKFTNRYTDNHTYVIMSSFVLGLLIDAPLILIKMQYGGYILGAIALIAGIVLKIMKAKNAVKT